MAFGGQILKHVSPGCIGAGFTFFAALKTHLIKQDFTQLLGGANIERSASQFVNLDDVTWIEGAGSFARLHLEDRTHVIEAGLDELAERFADDFVRIHSTLVRTSEIAEIQMTGEGESLVKLRDGRDIRLRRTERAQLLPASEEVEPG